MDTECLGQDVIMAGSFGGIDYILNTSSESS